MHKFCLWFLRSHSHNIQTQLLQYIEVCIDTMHTIFQIRLYIGAFPGTPRFDITHSVKRDSQVNSLWLCGAEHEPSACFSVLRRTTYASLYYFGNGLLCLLDHHEIFSIQLVLCQSIRSKCCFVRGAKRKRVALPLTQESAPPLSIHCMSATLYSYWASTDRLRLSMTVIRAHSLTHH